MFTMLNAGIFSATLTELQRLISVFTTFQI